jgi:hypothetical protein
MCVVNSCVRPRCAAVHPAASRWRSTRSQAGQRAGRIESQAGQRADRTVAIRVTASLPKKKSRTANWADTWEGPFFWRFRRVCRAPSPPPPPSAFGKPYDNSPNNPFGLVRRPVRPCAATRSALCGNPFGLVRQPVRTFADSCRPCSVGQGDRRRFSAKDGRDGKDCKDAYSGGKR